MYAYIYEYIYIYICICIHIHAYIDTCNRPIYMNVTYTQMVLFPNTLYLFPLFPKYITEFFFSVSVSLPLPFPLPLSLFHGFFSIVSSSFFFQYTWFSSFWTQFRQRSLYPTKQPHISANEPHISEKSNESREKSHITQQKSPISLSNSPMSRQTSSISAQEHK